MMRKWVTVYWKQASGPLRRAEGYDVAVTRVLNMVSIDGHFGLRHRRRYEEVDMSPTSPLDSSPAAVVVVPGTSHTMVATLHVLDSWMHANGITPVHNIRSCSVGGDALHPNKSYAPTYFYA